MCHERRPRKGNELDDEAGGSEGGGEARRKKGRREEEGEGRPRSDRARGPATGAGWGKGALVKHCARLYPRGKFLKRNYAPIEMSVSRKWMGPLRRDGGGERCMQPPVAALYPLCQLEVGYRRIDTGFPLSPYPPPKSAIRSTSGPLQPPPAGEAQFLHPSSSLLPPWARVVATEASWRFRRSCFARFIEAPIVRSRLSREEAAGRSLIGCFHASELPRHVRSPKMEFRSDRAARGNTTTR